MKKVILIAFCFLSFGLSYGQETNLTNQYFFNLSQPHGVNGATVEVNNYIEIDLISTKKTVNGFRISLFFDNSQTAREDAETERKRYSELYPSDKTYLAYNSPYWTLTAGNYLTYPEALVKWNRVVRGFKNAYIVKEELSLDHFKRAEDNLLEIE